MIEKKGSRSETATKINAKLEDFKIGVAARFRPSLNVANVADDEDGVTLPLHQKVQLVRKQLGCTSKEAVSLIMRKQQRLKNPKMSVESMESSGDSIFQPCLSPGLANKENRESNNAIIELEKNVDLRRDLLKPFSSFLFSSVSFFIFCYSDVQSVSFFGCDF